MINQKDELLQIMETYGTYLKKTAFHMLHDEQKAEDVTQETFIKYYYKNQFQNKSSVKTYLYSILMNEIKMVLRKECITSQARSYYCDETVSFESEVVNRLDLSVSIEELDLKYKQIIILFYFENFTIDEIKTILKISSSAVKMRLKRGKEQLKEIILRRTSYEKIN